MSIQPPPAKKKAPPVPKFQASQQHKQSLQSKFGQFLAEISDAHKSSSSTAPAAPIITESRPAPVASPETSTIKTTAPAPPALEVASPQQQPQTAPAEKKKINILNINQKLASMLNSKKDLLKSKQPESAPPKTQETDDSKKSIQPGAPNPSSNSSQSHHHMQTPATTNQSHHSASVSHSGAQNRFLEEYDPRVPNVYELVKDDYNETPTVRLNNQPKKAEAAKQIQAKDTKTINQSNSKEMQIQAPQEQPQQQQTGVLSEAEEKALKMMQKFGYRVGDGLGKMSQGITTPLTIKKTTESSCVIAPSSISFDSLVKPETRAKTTLEALNIKPSQVVVLNDIVKMAQFTQQVEDDIKAECQKYGKVKNLMIYLLGDVLRIFVEYETVENGFTAFVKLNERWFDSQMISVRFYSKEKMDAFKLDEPLHDHISF